MKSLECEPDTDLDQILTAHTITNDLLGPALRWLEQIEPVINQMGGDSEGVWLIRNFASLSCSMRTNCQPGASGELRVRQEEQIWRWYHEHVEQLKGQYLSVTTHLKESPTEDDYDAAWDDEQSPWQKIYDRSTERFGGPRWAELKPVQRTQRRMQMEAMVHWGDLMRTINGMPRLLKKILRKVYYKDVDSGKYFIRSWIKVAQADPLRRNNPFEWQQLQREEEEVYALYKTAINARRYVWEKIGPHTNKQGEIHLLPAVMAGRKAWADYWALTIPAIPLLSSYKQSKSCACRFCKSAEKDVAPALAGWLRANASSQSSRQIMAGLNREGTDPRTGYFYDLMGELEIRSCQKQVCYCRVPQLRNEAIAGLRKMHALRPQDQSLECLPEGLSDSTTHVEDEAIGNDRAEAILQEARCLLAPREFQVFELLLADTSYAEIGATLGIKTGTVGATINRIRKKLEGVVAA